MKHSGKIGGIERLCHIQSMNTKENLSVIEDYIVNPKVQATIELSTSYTGLDTCVTK
jgi:hypothetical protein